MKQSGGCKGEKMCMFCIGLFSLKVEERKVYTDSEDLEMGHKRPLFYDVEGRRFIFTSEKHRVRI